MLSLITDLHIFHSYPLLSLEQVRPKRQALIGTPFPIAAAAAVPGGPGPGSTPAVQVRNINEPSFSANMRLCLQKAKNILERGREFKKFYYERLMAPVG